MKAVLALVVFSLAAVSAYPTNSYYRPGFVATHNGYAAPYRNDLRQEAVNDKARYVGAGVGTEAVDGVPGSGNYFGYGGYGGYHGGNNYGYNGYRGYNGYYNDGYYNGH